MQDDLMSAVRSWFIDIIHSNSPEGKAGFSHLNLIMRIAKKATEHITHLLAYTLIRIPTGFITLKPNVKQNFSY